MTRFLPVLILVHCIVLQPALAEDRACLNPHFSYRAQPSGDHDVVAQNTIGSHTARVHITTSCVDLHKADVISLSTAFGCLGKGDDVIATSIDGRRQSCIVTNIVPDAPAKNATSP